MFFFFFWCENGTRDLGNKSQVPCQVEGWSCKSTIMASESPQKIAFLWTGGAWKHEVIESRVGKWTARYTGDREELEENAEGVATGSCPPRPIYRLSRAYSHCPPLSRPQTLGPPPSQRFIGKTCSGDISSPPLEGSGPPLAASPWLRVYWISSKTAWKPRSLAWVGSALLAEDPRKPGRYPGMVWVSARPPSSRGHSCHYFSREHSSRWAMAC